MNNPNSPWGTQDRPSTQTFDDLRRAEAVKAILLQLMSEEPGFETDQVLEILNEAIAAYISIQARDSSVAGIQHAFRLYGETSKVYFETLAASVRLKHKG